jgi:ankyrin repeat protein
MSTTQEISPDLVQDFVINAHGNLVRVKELYEQEPGLLNIPWARFDETALAAASHMGNRAIAEFLLEIGAPMTVCTAAMLGMEDRVAAYLDEDPSLANAQGAHGIPIMFHAAMSGNTRVTDLLASRGGGEGINDSLHGAVAFGHKEMVAWLFAHGVDNPNPPSFDGKTPLAVAIEKGYDDIADLLRDNGGVEIL